MDLSLETSIDVLDQQADFYLDTQQVEKSMQIVRQMDQLGAEYCSLYETLRYCMNSRYNNNSNVKTSGLLQSMGITEVSESYYGKKEIFSQEISREPDTRVVSTIEQDLWKQLKRFQIPVFSGDKRNNKSWKAAFLACIDSAPATSEHKLLQLRQCLSGEALNAIKDLGHSATAYDTAKE